MHDPRPLLIGVSPRLYYPESGGVDLGGVWTKTLHYLEQSVAHWVLASGAMAVMVPAVTRDSIVKRQEVHLADYAAALDGLLLQGGNDVAPTLYGQAPLRPEWTGDAVRDAYEMALIRAFVAAGKPVFGICRGLQLLNVAHGGTLWQDIVTQCPQARTHVELARYEHHHHRIALQPGSRLAALFPGVDGGTVNSIHHQGIRDLAPGFEVEARSVDDGLIEAIRHTGPVYIAGVQWHPEFHDHEAGVTLDDRPLLEDFLAACRAARRR
jgi:putative glutamine amidotransferase